MGIKMRLDIKLEITCLSNETRKEYLYPVGLVETIHYVDDKWQISSNSDIEKGSISETIVATIEWLDKASKGHGVVCNQKENKGIMINLEEVGNWMRFYRVSKLLDQEDAIGYLASVHRGLTHLLDPKSELRNGDPAAVKSFSNIIEKLK